MSGVYTPAKQALLEAFLNGKTIKAALIDEGVYTYSAAHQFKSSLTGIVAESDALTGITFTDGVLDAANTVLTGVSGDTVEAVAFYIDTGSPATSELICYINGLNLTPDGGNVSLEITSILSL